MNSSSAVNKFCLGKVQAHCLALVFKPTLIAAGLYANCLFSFSALAEEKHASHGLPSFSEFLAEEKIYWLNFLIYLVLLFIVLTKVFSKAWTNRRQAYLEAINSGQKYLQDSERKLVEAQNKTAGLPAELTQIRTRLTKEIDFEAKQIITEASQRAEKIKTQAGQTSAAEQRAAINNYQEQLVELAIIRAKAKVPELMSGEISSRLNNKVVDSMQGLLN